MLISLLLRNWRIVILVVIGLGCLAAGIWFRGVLADRAELRAENVTQASELQDLIDEAERMNRVLAADHALFENVEAQKKIFAADMRKQAAELKRLRKELSDETRRCFDAVLPQSYLDGLPKEVARD